VPTPNTTTDGLFAALDLGVFEQDAGGLFRLKSHPPDWLHLNHDAGDPIDLGDRFPLLEVFLPDCENMWATGIPSRIESDIWTEPDPRGGELYLQAVAMLADGRNVVVLRSLPQALFTYQQLAHDFELEKEKVERLSRELDLKRREAERATEAKSNFLATMSHEIRTPLNAIIGMADVLSTTALTPEQKKCVDVFQRNGVGLLNLINDILDLSKVEAGHVELEQLEFDLREVIARAMEVVEIRAAAKGLWLRQVIAPGVPVHLIGDPDRLRQIIINLLGNSIKFTDHGGLEVRVEPDPGDCRQGRLRFAISDTGIGIPADKLGSIFESFTQADSSTTRKYGGTGLGLTISRQLVELMDGRIRVESEPGAGSTFYFTAGFKVQEDQSERQAIAQSLHTSLADLEKTVSGLHILLADDSEDNRFLILAYLRRTDCAIDVAENGEMAATMFKKGHYDLVLMDVEMPVMDGYEATREIRRFEHEAMAQETPVLALTAHAFADMSARGFEAGFTDLLTKPIRNVTLLEALARYVPKDKPPSETPPVTPEVIRVRMEEGMEDVVPGYLEKRRAEVRVYREALAAADFDAIKKLAHKMKGTGAGYGFPVLTELGGALEKAALAADAAAVLDDVNRFADYVERIRLE
jgi:signal transduction histidine kinase/CheY-like chemotaxis protein